MRLRLLAAAAILDRLVVRRRSRTAQPGHAGYPGDGRSQCRAGDAFAARPVSAGADPPESEAGLQKLTRDHRLRSAPGSAGNSGVFEWAAGAAAPRILLARGTFDVPKILEAARPTAGPSKPTKAFPSCQDSRSRDRLAFPDSTLAIFGDAADVRAAIDRMTAPTAISSALAVQVNQLSTSEDAWFVSMAPLSQLQPAAPSAADRLRIPWRCMQSAAGQRRREIRSQRGGESAGGLGDGPGCRGAGHGVEGDGHWI